MVGAVSRLVDDGRVKLYCVDSFDHASWSDRSLPLEERARQHQAYQSWITHEVASYVGSDSAGAGDWVATGCSLGAYHALQVALQRADLFPVAICQSGNYDPSTWYAWGERGDAAYFTNPDRLRPAPARRPPRLAARATPRRADRRPRGVGDAPDRLAAQRTTDGAPAGREADLPRPRHLGARRLARLALVAHARSRTISRATAERARSGIHTESPMEGAGPTGRPAPIATRSG